MGLIKKIRKNRKAISPVIATIIIVAVTIAVSVAVAGWMMGLWGGLTKTEAIRLTPVSLKTDGSYSFMLTNSGSADATVTKITIGGSNVSPVIVDGTSYILPTPGFTVTAAGQRTVTGAAGAAGITPVSGRTYDIHVYTAAGNDFLSQIVAVA